MSPVYNKEEDSRADPERDVGTLNPAIILRIIIIIIMSKICAYFTNQFILTRYPWVVQLHFFEKCNGSVENSSEDS